MTTSDKTYYCWSAASFRLSHPDMNLSAIPDQLKIPSPKLDFPPSVEAEFIRKGMASYWSARCKIEFPDRPNILFAWSEQLAYQNKLKFLELLEMGGILYVYIGIHTNMLALGFDLPPTPTIDELGITIGVEYFSA